MATVNLKTATAASSVARAAVLIGAESQSADSPSVYPLPLAGAALFAPGVFLSQFDLTTDGTGDNSQALIDAIAELPDYGGTIFVNVPGILRTTSPVPVTKPNVKIRGMGHRNATYSEFWQQQPDGPAVIYSDHAGACFSFAIGDGADDEISGFECSDLSAQGNSDDYPASSFCSFSGTPTDFNRNFIFDRIAVTHFGCGWKVSGSGGSTAIGSLRITNSNIMYNLFIAQCDGGGQINQFVFRDNDAGQNGYGEGQGGLDIRAIAACIEGNILEGQRDPIKVTGAYRGISVRANYFEANVGVACVQLDGVSEFDVGCNTFLSVSTDYNVFLKNCGMGSCSDPYFGYPLFKVNPPVGCDSTGRRILVPESTENGLPLWLFNRPEWGGIMPVSGDHTPSYDQSMYVAGRRIPVQRHSIAPASNGLVVSTVNVAASSGQWAVVQLMLRLNDATPADDPYMTLSVNNTADAGSAETPLVGWANFVRTGEVVMATAAIRLHSAMTSLGVYIWPYGISPANEESITFDKSQIQVSIIDDLAEFVPGMNVEQACQMSAAPSGGAWARGETIPNSAPAAEGSAGWICTAAGTPGTWKALGTIAA